MGVFDLQSTGGRDLQWTGGDPEGGVEDCTQKPVKTGFFCAQNRSPQKTDQGLLYGVFLIKHLFEGIGDTGPPHRRDSQCPSLRTAGV
jgi:hypothetical protein